MPARRYSSPGAPNAALRLLSHLAATPDDGCWTTRLAVGKRGYPRMSLRGQAVIAARVTLEAKLGRRLEPRESTRHTCDNTACVRPDHLLAGTQAQNNKDRDERQRLARDPQTGRYKPC